MRMPPSATLSAAESPFRDLEITGAGLEQAFMALTGCGSFDKCRSQRDARDTTLAERCRLRDDP